MRSYKNNPETDTATNFLTILELIFEIYVSFFFLKKRKI